MSRTAAASTMLRMTNFLIALSFGTQRAQLVQRTAFTWPRLCLQRPPLRLFLVCAPSHHQGGPTATMQVNKRTTRLVKSHKPPHNHQFESVFMDSHAMLKRMHIALCVTLCMCVRVCVCLCRYHTAGQRLTPDARKRNFHRPPGQFRGKPQSISLPIRFPQ